MLYLNLTDFSTASKMLNLNNVAEVERKESLFSLPKCSNVSKKTLRKSSAKKACFLCRDAATSRRNTVQAMYGVATEWEQHRMLRSAVTEYTHA